MLLLIGDVLNDRRGDAGIVGEMRKIESEIVLVADVVVSPHLPLMLGPIDVLDDIFLSFGDESTGGGVLGTLGEFGTGDEVEAGIVRAVDLVIVLD